MAGMDGSCKVAPIREDEIVNELGNEKLYVAVSKELRACKSTLAWALQKNLGVKRVCVIHVHQPAQTISVLGARFQVSSLSEKEVRLHWLKERQDMCKILDDYLHICAKAGVEAEKLYIEMDTVEKGIVELISQHEIKRLVMGAAADNRYSRKIMEPKSKKAIYVRQHAPAFCHVWFVCKGRLIYTREGTKQPHLQEENNDNGLSIEKSRLTQSTSGWSTPVSRTDSDRSLDDFDRSSTFSLSPLTGFLRSSALVSRVEERESSSRPHSLPPRPEEKQNNLPSQNLPEETTKNALYDQLEQAMVEADIAKREAFRESFKCRKAEKEAVDATRKAEAAESLYFEELRRREELEKELAKVKEELENTKKQRDMALEEVRAALDQKLLLETRVQKSDVMEKELEDKIMSALHLLQNYKQL